MQIAITALQGNVGNRNIDSSINTDVAVSDVPRWGAQSGAAGDIWTVAGPRHSVIGCWQAGSRTKYLLVYTFVLFQILSGLDRDVGPFGRNVETCPLSTHRLRLLLLGQPLLRSREMLVVWKLQLSLGHMNRYFKCLTKYGIWGLCVERPYLKSSVLRLRFETFLCNSPRPSDALLLELSTKFHIIQRRPSIDSSTYFAALAEVAHELGLAVLVQVEAGARPRGLGRRRPGARCG